MSSPTKQAPGDEQPVVGGGGHETGNITGNLSSPGLGGKDFNVTMEPMGELDGAINSLAQAAKYNLLSMSPRMLLLTRWKMMKSWGGFADTSKMQLPANVQQWSRRLVKNLAHFQSNYLMVFCILLIYCILTSPLLLLALSASFGACYIVALKNAERPVKFFGHKLQLGQQYLVIAIVSLPLFYLVGAGSAVFWVIGASLFVIGLHASVYAIETVQADQTDDSFHLTFAQPATHSPLTNIQSV